MRRSILRPVVHHVLAKAIEPSMPVRRVSTFALASREPPVEMQLWNVGPNGTDYGTHVWTERSAAEVMGAYQARGNPLVIDIEHNEAGVAGAKDVAGPTAGYARLELRDGAPWVVFDWSDVAVEQIRTGQRKFISPDYYVDKKTGEIVGLSRVSLVANPGTHRARMLATAEGLKMDPKTVAGLLAILSATEDPVANIAAAQAFLGGHTDAGSGGGLDGPPGDPDGPPPAPVAADAAPEEKPKEGAPMPFKKDEDKKPDAVAAAADDPDKDKDKKTVAAAAPPATVAASAAPVVDLVARREMENIKRDMLIDKHGARLGAHKAFAASQPLAVVEALIKTLPADLAPPARVTATRGDGQGNGIGSPYGRDGFQPGSPEFAEFQRMTGTAAPLPVGPRILANGALQIIAGPPGEWRKQEAERVRASGKVK